MEAMYHSNITCELKELFCSYQIGTITDDPLIVSGGLLHRMYKVTTETNTYAVKSLNPTIMKRVGVLDNMIHSELIATVLSEYVPVVAAIRYQSQNVLHWNHNYYMVFPWMDGSSIYPPLINTNHCYKIGYLLGKIHHGNVTIPEIQKENENNTIRYDWNHFKKLGSYANVSWLDMYTKVVDYLYLWTNRVNTAVNELTEFMVISHRDLDPKNIMWNCDNPYLIDWEAAGYINPYQELLEVLNYWSDNGSSDLDRDNFNSLLQGYTCFMNIDEVDWDLVLDSGYGGMLGWLDYNLKRALGLETTDDTEKTLGEEQINSTINELIQYDTKKYTIKTWLKQYSLS